MSELLLVASLRCLVPKGCVLTNVLQYYLYHYDNESKGAAKICKQLH